MKHIKEFLLNEKIDETLLSAEKRWPELEKIADEIFNKYVGNIASDISKKCESIDSKMPYKTQCVLEMLIKKFEELV